MAATLVASPCSATIRLPGPSPRSLVFEFEVDDGGLKAAACSQVSQAYLAMVKERLAFLARPPPAGEFASKLNRDVWRFKRAVLREEHQHDAVVLATKLAAVGYNVSVRTALGGGPACFKNLHHEFLAVYDPSQGAEYIVEPNFREHFQIPHPTATYREVLAAVADEFVGTKSRLVPLVQLLCAEMAASFAAMGLTLPPWRRAQSMQTKWLPNKARDVSYTSAAPAPRQQQDQLPAAVAAAAAGYPSRLTTSVAAGVAAQLQRVTPGHHDCRNFLGSGGCDGNCGSCNAFARLSDRQLAASSPKAQPHRSLLSGKLLGTTGSNGSSSIGSSSSGGLVSVKPPVHCSQPSIHKVTRGVQPSQ